MRITSWIILTLLLIGLAACTGGGILLPGSTKTSSLPTAQVTIVSAPDVNSALHSFLDAQLVENYPTMYALLSKSSQAAISQADFASRYINALNSMSAGSTSYNILSSLTNPQSAQAAFHIVYHTVLFGDIARDINVNLVLENGGWKIQWDDGLILPELAGGKQLAAAHVAPARGDIYDSNGNAIVTQADADAIGLVAGNINSDHEGALLNALYRLTGIRPETIRSLYDNTHDGDYVPVGEATADEVAKSGISNYSGVTLNPYTSRFYEPNTAPHAVGYTLFISKEQLNTYKRLGYNGSERVGFEGIEKWGEQYLHGRDQASLYVGGDQNNVLAQTDSQPADSIYLTIDNDLQQQAQAAMDGLPGAAVVMDVNTGKILALVSSPGYDPNLYDANNFNNQWSLLRMLNDTNQPTFNRATQGQYPLGSVFKIVTIAAALQSGVFTPSSTWDCEYTYTEIQNVTLYDWTWEDCQKEKAQTGNSTCTKSTSQPSGMLKLPDGLMRSCDPWFYHIGYTLYSADDGKDKEDISNMARAFGLGKATGIGQVAEATGNIPDPTDGLDATSIAIGQGKVLVTPLQVATFISAVANGGTLYRPQLVEKVQPVSGDSIDVFRPQAQGTLPISADNLAVIQAAMRQVAVNPRGTGYYTLGNFAINVAAKTGTAETSATQPNAWFAGYSMENSPNKPDIAVVVMVSNQGEGAIWAAPIFRRIMEIYFFGHPQYVYPWEKSFGVVNPNYGQVATPTPTP
ncbi:MAG TPA: penicillin-binding transpeptidase domain-containing protein [Anaerolineales bacterium]|nr:penicillin-binding transpeptidase domain-containing protein [Anaerolineales bacterium]